MPRAGSTTSQPPSCIACREAKRFCDRNTPCLRCVQNGLQCIPHTRGPGRPPKKRPPPPGTRPASGCTAAEPAAETADVTVPRIVANLNNVVARVTQAIVSTIVGRGQLGLLDHEKVQAVMNVLASWNQMSGRECIPEYRHVMDWAASVARPQYSCPVEEAILREQEEARDADAIRQMTQEDGYYIKVVYKAPGSADIMTSRGMGKHFISSEEILGFFRQTGLAHIYSWASFIAEESISDFYDFFIRFEMERGLPNRMDTVVQCKMRDGRHVPCVVSLGRRRRRDAQPGLLILRLMPMSAPTATAPLGKRVACTDEAGDWSAKAPRSDYNSSPAAATLLSRAGAFGPSAHDIPPPPTYSVSAFAPSTPLDPCTSTHTHALPCISIPLSPDGPLPATPHVSLTSSPADGPAAAPTTPDAIGSVWDDDDDECFEGELFDEDGLLVECEAEGEAGLFLSLTDLPWEGAEQPIWTEVTI